MYVSDGNGDVDEILVRLSKLESQVPGENGENGGGDGGGGGTRSLNGGGGGGGGGLDALFEGIGVRSWIEAGLLRRPRCLPAPAELGWGPSAKAAD